MMDRINDKWVRIGGLALMLLNLFIMDIGNGRRSWSQQAIYLTVYILSVVLILESGRFIILYMHRKHPEAADRRKRFWRTCLFVFLNDFLLILFTFYLSHWVRGMRPGNSPFFFIAVFVSSIILALVQTGIYESFYYFLRLQKLEKEKEELLRINLQSQFDSLKQQVNPHFLFNSINTVSSLIDRDPAKAKKYLAEMSRVYRYMLQANEEGLTTLQTELQFLQSYFHLLKTRFQDGLELKVETDECYSHYYLPPLTLQLLVENAVKHNSIDKSRPLIIDIRTAENGWLSVKNNLQKKVNAIPSTRIGLANIMAKYRFLNQPEIKIHETEHEFSIQIPLIKNQML